MVEARARREGELRISGGSDRYLRGGGGGSGANCQVTAKHFEVSDLSGRSGGEKTVKKA